MTPDSFSDGGKFLDIDDAIKQAQAMSDAGADILDIGGESTRPGSLPINADQEMSRILPIIKEVASFTDVLISVDTQKSKVAEVALSCGAHIINDISAGKNDAGMFRLIAESKAGYVMMHMQGIPETMQQAPGYIHVISEINEFFNDRIREAIEAGVNGNQIALDPGIGFGKNLDDNLRILANIAEFNSFNKPIVLGASRKSFIGMIDDSTPSERIGGSLAAVLSTYHQGVHIYRVHDVAETRQALDIFSAIQKHSG